MDCFLLSENVSHLLLRFVWSAILLERASTDFLFGHGNLYSFAIEFLCLEGDFMVFDFASVLVPSIGR